ncbi:hypothetical protein ABW21_db0203770 [Orbilia brochopaga]|nr:hypothetical protein ABW21_db0203770 [Drechslerella brochopaga]
MEICYKSFPQSSLLRVLCSLANRLTLPHLAFTASCFALCVLTRCSVTGATIPTKNSLHPNFSASLFLVQTFGFDALSRCIFLTSASLRWYVFAYGRASDGGSFLLVGLPCASRISGRAAGGVPLGAVLRIAVVDGGEKRGSVDGMNNRGVIAGVGAAAGGL